MYSYESRISYSEVGEDGKLSLLGIIDNLQDCSTFQSEDIGLGVAHMGKLGFGWFLAGWDIEVLGRPKLCERVAVSTWNYEITKLYGCRNYTITGLDGHEYVRADSLWFLYNGNLGRPVKIPEEIAKAYLAQGGKRLASPMIKRRIPVEGDGRTADAIRVVKQHLDTNHHVNNAQYIEMAVDATGSAFDTGRIGVQYIKAATLGDTIIPCIHDTSDGSIVELADEAGSAYAVVKLVRGQIG